MSNEDQTPRPVQQEKEEKPHEEETFEDYMRNARNKFVEIMVKYFPHEYHKDFVDGIPVIDMRVAAEDILIAYDQMREKLSPSHPLSEHSNEKELLEMCKDAFYEILHEENDPKTVAGGALLILTYDRTKPVSDETKKWAEGVIKKHKQSKTPDNEK